MSENHSQIPYKNIFAWRKGYEFVKEVYRVTKVFLLKKDMESLFN